MDDTVYDRLTKFVPIVEQQRLHIERLRELVADLLEWADHQADCLIHDDGICDCGYDALAEEWKKLRG